MDLAYLQGQLKGRRLGWPFLYYARVSSTQDVVAAAAAEGAAEGLLVLAEEQTAGRGRSGREWWAPPGTAILGSLLLRPRLAPQRVSWLGMIVGLAVTDAVHQCTGLPAALKWPNDVWLFGRKLGGILVEAMWHGETLDAVIVGLGLNVTTSFPPSSPLRERAISLQAAGVTVRREGILVTYLTRLGEYYDRLLAGWSPVALWRERLCTLNRPVYVLKDEERWEGWAEDVTELGELVVRRGNNRVVVQAADVHLRHMEDARGEEPSCGGAA